MKPSWDDAPESAEWLARDKDGTWCWYSKKPTIRRQLWMPPEDGYCQPIDDDAEWMYSLEPRP